jgi:hypothetical protein
VIQALIVKYAQMATASPAAATLICFVVIISHVMTKTICNAVGGAMAQYAINFVVTARNASGAMQIPYRVNRHSKRLWIIITYSRVKEQSSPILTIHLFRMVVVLRVDGTLSPIIHLDIPLGHAVMPMIYATVHA